MGRLYTDTPFVIYFGESSSQPIGDDPNLCMALNLTYNFVRYSYKDLGANITSPWPSLFWSFCCLFRSHFCPFSWVKSRFQDAGCPTGGPDLSLLGRTCRGSRSHRKTHWCKGRLTADTLKHRKNVARKKKPWVSLHFPKNQSMDKVTSRCSQLAFWQDGLKPCNKLSGQLHHFWNRKRLHMKPRKSVWNIKTCFGRW